jgi:drug/metabolite transporter (DMT)-like permease
MWWIWLSLATGFFVATQGALAKRYSTGRRSLVITWAASAFSLPFFVAYAWRVQPLLPELTTDFVLFLGANTAMLLIASLLYFSAIQVGQLSRDLPLLSLTPIFMILTSWLMVGQRPSVLGAVAMTIIVVGCLILQKTPSSRWRSMIAAIIREPGSRRMLLVALIWSITANVDKLCVSEVGPVWYPALLNASLSLALLPVAWLGRACLLATLKELYAPLVGIGVFQAAAALAQMPAVEVAPHVGYVISLKRGGLMLFGIIWGMLLYNERNIGWRMFGAIWILAGLLLLSYQATQ